LDSRFSFQGSGKQGTCFQICLKQLREALEIQGAISDFDLFWTAVTFIQKPGISQGIPFPDPGVINGGKQQVTVLFILFF